MKQWINYFGKNNPITLNEIKHIDHFYKMSDDELLQAYQDRFLKLFQHAIKKSAFYKELYASNGIGINDIKHLDDIKKLPVVDRELLKNKVDDNFIGWDKLKVVGLTSGTSGTPLTLYRTYQNIAKEQAYIRQYRNQKGFKFGEPLLSIRGMLGKSVDYEYFKPANILYISSPNINKSTIEMYHKLVKDFAPKAVEAFPSYLHKFSLELERKNLALNIPLAFTSSETLLDWQRSKIENYLGAQLYDWYGNAERNILLAQNNNMSYLPMPLYCIPEYLPKDIISTNLTNFNFPLIRYHIHDNIQVESTDFLNNIIKPNIIKIEGRASENVDLKDGSVVGCLDHAFKAIPHLNMAQIHQYDVQKPIVVKLVVAPEFSKIEEDQLRKNWIRMVGTDMDIIFEYCTREDLIQQPGKKFRLIIKEDPKKIMQ
jgi:phenylacetate-CoA ligase